MLCRRRRYIWSSLNCCSGKGPHHPPDARICIIQLGGRIPLIRKGNSVWLFLSRWTQPLQLGVGVEWAFLRTTTRDLLDRPTSGRSLQGKWRAEKQFLLLHLLSSDGQAWGRWLSFFYSKGDEAGVVSVALVSGFCFGYGFHQQRRYNFHVDIRWGWL